MHHKKLLAEIKKHKGRGTAHSKSDSYIGSGHYYYDVSVPARRAIARKWLAANKNISEADFLKTIDDLNKGKSHEEKTMASSLIGYHALHRKNMGPKHVDKWLTHLVGWAEVDSLCQNVFTADEMLANWKAWENQIRKFSKDKNISKRRAALVLLTGPVHYSSDKRISELAFEMMERLKSEREILITKAVSWLLRSMITRHKAAVAEYVKKNSASLPSIAVRETLNKIKTGRK